MGVAVITRMSTASPFPQGEPLMDTEPMLLIDNRKAEVVEHDALLK